MGNLDFKTPFEELTELRSMLSMNEIAEMTGMRRETLSRARPGSRFQRRTQKALDDLYLVVARLRPTMGGDTVHLAAVMRRPQTALAHRSIAELLREGKAAEVLEHLGEPEPAKRGGPGTIEFDPALLARLEPTPKDDPREQVHLVENERQVATLLDSDPDLASRLPAIEAKIHEYFGADAQIGRAIITEYDDAEGGDELYLRILTSLTHDDEVDRLTKLLGDEGDLLDPVATRLTIGML